MTQEIASEREVEVDLAGFQVEMEAQRERAKAAAKGGAGLIGLNFYPPSPRAVTPEAAAQLAGRAPPIPFSSMELPGSSTA